MRRLPSKIDCLSKQPMCFTSMWLQLPERRRSKNITIGAAINVEYRDKI